MRPQIISDLELEKYGFKYLPRNPSSFTPTLLNSKYEGKYLILGSDVDANWRSIAQFSVDDANAYPEYENFLGKIREVLQPLLDMPPPDISQGGLMEKLHTLSSTAKLINAGYKHKEILVPFYELFTGPAQQVGYDFLSNRIHPYHPSNHNKHIPPSSPPPSPFVVANVRFWIDGSTVTSSRPPLPLTP